MTDSKVTVAPNSNSISLESLKPRILQILADADLNSISVKDIRNKLEEELHVSLVEIKHELKELVSLLYQEVLERQVLAEAARSDSSSSEESSVEKDAKVKLEEQLRHDELLARELQGEFSRTSRSSHSARNSSLKKPKKKRKAATSKPRQSGFTAPLLLAESLRDFFGVEELARTQVVKRLWEHIKERNLQDPSDRRVIVCDDALLKIFKRPKVGAFQMNKLLAPMLTKKDDVMAINANDSADDSNESEVEDAPRRKVRKSGKKQGSAKGKTRSSSVTQRENGFKRPLLLSPALAQFLQIEKLDRPQVVKRIWDYIKEQKLQDPSDKRYILCDKKLQNVFEVDRLHMFTMNKVLATHLKALDEVVPTDIKELEASAPKRLPMASGEGSNSVKAENSDEFCPVKVEDSQSASPQQSPSQL